MQRIIDGVLFESSVLPDCYEVRTWRSNGVMERSARQCLEWREIGPVPDNDAWDAVKDAAVLEERAERNLKRNAMMAKQKCRRLIITAGFDELLTLTYKANQLDRDLCKRQFKEWVRRMKRSLPGFQYCASFERQERGAMHVHVATNKLPVHAAYKGVKIAAWKLGTEVWRSVVGDLGGMCHVGGKTRHGGRRRNLSLAKMAAYVSKYIMKDYESSPAGSNRFSRSNGIVISKAEIIRLTRCSYADLIQLTFEMSPGDILVSHRLNLFKDAVWFCTESGVTRVST